MANVKVTALKEYITGVDDKVKKGSSFELNEQEAQLMASSGFVKIEKEEKSQLKTKEEK